MSEREHIIAIRNRNIREADNAFAEFMRISEKCINDKAKRFPLEYKRSSPSELEVITRDVLIETSPVTPFLKDDIKLISGQSFPDIVAAGYYGVEVKSTKSNSWKSTGSSIVESTRIESVENIYMMFGCLGANPPSFRCKPYQECLYDIAVTHSPRYLIDMDIVKNNDIFSKMQTNYDMFRKLGENEKINKIRCYYKEKSKSERRVAMPWWMGDVMSPEVRLYKDLDREEKKIFQSKALILFPSIFQRNPQIAYQLFALWLCSRYSLLCHNVRDMFTAGGITYVEFNGKTFGPYPKMVKTLLNMNAIIKRLLNNPSEELIKDINELEPFKNCKGENYYAKWLYMVEKRFNANKPYYKNAPIRDFITKGAIPLR